MFELSAIIKTIEDVVRRYASLGNIPKEDINVTHETKPYSDLGMDSLHDLNIACEVEAILGVQLPGSQKLLAGGGRALSILQAAQAVAKHVAPAKANAL